MGDNTLLEGIYRDAGEEAARILEQAEKQARDKIAGVEKPLEEIRREAREEREKKLEEIKRRSDSAVTTAQRRISLKRREYLYSLVMREAEKRIFSLISSSEYPDILAKWIAEGAVGLDKSEAKVSCSFKETLTPEILEKAAGLVKAHTGKEVKLYIEDSPLKEQGVAVSSMDGRISFHNQVPIRFRRYDQEIRKSIFDASE